MGLVFLILVIIASLLFALVQPGSLSFSIVLLSFLMPAVSIISAFFCKSKLSAAYASPESLGKNVTADIEFRLQNDSIYPFRKVVIDLDFVNELTGEIKSMSIVMSAPMLETSIATIAINSENCGSIRIKVNKIRVFDICGIIAFCNTISQKEKRIVIIPEYKGDENNHISFGIGEDSDTYSDTVRGNDYSETFQIREYVEGDFLRQIHWKLSSKTDRIIVKEGSLPLEKSILLFWDRSKFSGWTPGLSSKSVEAIIEFCIPVLKQGTTVGIAWNDRNSNGIFYINLASEDDLYENIPRLLRAGTVEDSGVLEFVKLFGQFENVVYVSVNDGSEKQQLSSQPVQLIEVANIQ